MKLSRDGELKAPKPGRRRAGGRLNATQAARIRALMVAKMPDQLKLPFYLWTREAVARLIEREYGVTVSPTTVGALPQGMGYERAQARASCIRKE